MSQNDVYKCEHCDFSHEDIKVLLFHLNFCKPEPDNEPTTQGQEPEHFSEV
jgi:hypothetical protein